MQLFWKIWTVVIQWQKLLLKRHVLHCGHFNLACLQQLAKQGENPPFLLFSQADVSVCYIQWKKTHYFGNSVDSLQLMWSVPQAQRDQALEINSIKWCKAWNFTYIKQKLIYIGIGRKIIILGTKMSSGTFIHHTTCKWSFTLFTCV